MLCDIEAEAPSRAEDSLKTTNADVHSVRADVSLKDELKATAEATLARFDKVHILVNNAGVGGGGPYGFWTEASWEWTLSVNLMAVIWGVEIFGPLIEQHGEGGHIVSTASMAGLMSSGSTSYNVSKYGVVALSEGLRVELAPRGIGVSVLCPAFVRTSIVDFLRNLPERFPRPNEQRLNAFRSSETFRILQDRVSKGVDPRYVGELVREGIENDWPYIFTDNEFEPFVDARFAAIKAGFDRIRGRQPLR